MHETWVWSREHSTLSCFAIHIGGQMIPNSTTLHSNNNNNNTIKVLCFEAFDPRFFDNERRVVQTISDVHHSVIHSTLTRWTNNNKKNCTNHHSIYKIVLAFGIIGERAYIDCRITGPQVPEMGFILILLRPVRHTSSIFVCVSTLMCWYESICRRAGRWWWTEFYWVRMKSIQINILDEHISSIDRFNGAQRESEKYMNTNKGNPVEQKSSQFAGN